MNREYYAHLPPSIPPGYKLPLVLVLHGMGSTAASMIYETGWSEKSNERGFIAVYPEATRPYPNRKASFIFNPQSWNDGSGRFQSGINAVDDIAFLKLVIDDCISRYPVDTDRIFITGFSNGACMSFLAANHLSDQIQAVAPVSGCDWSEIPEPKKPVSIIYISGTADPLNPLEGGLPTMQFGGKQWGGIVKPAFIDYFRRWTTTLQCQEKPVITLLKPEVKQFEFSPCNSETRATAILVEKLGHVWPGGNRTLPEFILGVSSNSISATDMIWDFFESCNSNKSSDTHPHPTTLAK